MGKLAEFLQDRFAERCPDGWKCDREVQILDSRLARLFGYAPQADVVLERLDGSRKLWIEFEISRADPVANHAKFATAHLFQPQLANETFVSMVSSHVVRGRRNLAANTIFLMRHIGMNAFQTMLLPTVPPLEIARLNHLTKPQISELQLAIESEISRAIRVSEALGTTDRYRVFFVGELLEVMCNLQYWNRSVLTADGGTQWGRRRVQYFVFDPKTNLFAPSKFCAFRPIPMDAKEAASVLAANMTMDLYASLDESDPRFDGNRAWRHLHEHLGMTVHELNEDADLAQAFDRWIQSMGDAIQLNGKGAKILVPPVWFQ